MAQYWSCRNGIRMYIYGADDYGIVAFLGHYPTAVDLKRCFKGTAAAVWGNILKGEKATGKYAEIIQGIKKFGFQGFVLKYNDCDSYRHYSKNRSERHLRVGRRTREKIIQSHVFSYN